MTKKVIIKPAKKGARTRKHTTKTPMKTIRAKVSDEVYEKMANLVREGWFPSQDYIINDALSRFVYSHRPEVMEKSILDDVRKALRGE